MGGGGGGGSPLGGIGQTVGSVVGALNPLGAIGGNVIGGIWDNKGSQANMPGGMDPALAALRDKRIKEAKDFRADAPGLEQDMGRDLNTQMARGLQADQAENKASFNRRGLMGSGLNQGADAAASGKAAVGLAKGKQDLHNQLQDQADQMENAAITNGYQYWQSSKALQDSAYNSALSNMMASRSGTTALIGAAAKGGAAAAGGV